MDYSKNSITNFAILSLLLAAVIYLATCSSLTSNSSFSYPRFSHVQSNHTEKVKKDELELALEKAATPEKTVIIAIVNKAYVEPQHDGFFAMFDLFLEGFWEGKGTRWLLDHVLVVAMDRAAYNRCMFRRLNCYMLETEGVDFAGEKVYMSDAFIKMMWRRTLFLQNVLKHGYNFIFTDTDIMWLRNPFPRLRKNETEDLQISTDSYNGNPWSENNPINTGFYYIKSNNKTIALFDEWYGARNNSAGMKEQDVLANLIQKGIVKELGLRVRFLDTLYFSGFCNNSKDVEAVVTVHANCCRSISAKVTDLSGVLRDWKRFNGSSSVTMGNETIRFQWSKHSSCMNSWHVPVRTING